jgi:hypothetical protein
VIPAKLRFHQHYTKIPCGCWLWTGYRDRKGYAKIRNDQGKKVWAHRFSYEMHNGPIQEGMTVDHTCRRTSCVNPDHLELVTLEENNRRARIANYG